METGLYYLPTKKFIQLLTTMIFYRLSKFVFSPQKLTFSIFAQLCTCITISNTIKLMSNNVDIVNVSFLVLTLTELSCVNVYLFYL